MSNTGQVSARTKEFGQPGHRLAVLAVAACLGLMAAAVAGRGSLSAPASSAETVGTLPPSTLAVTTRPPVSPNPSAPGVPIGAGPDQSDPILYVSAGRYFLFTSGQPGLRPLNVPVTSSADFTNWGPVDDALPTLPGWAVPGYTWAPDVHRFGSTFVLYFTAMLKGTTPAVQCIGSSVGPSPSGPFVPMAVPFICQLDQGGSIDPRVFTDATGANWMLWKSDQNIAGSATPTKLWSEPLSADGLSLTGRPADILEPDRAWQGTIVEAPDMVEAGGAYWVFYSGNWFNQAAYGIGAARCAGPAGPCADTSDLPLLGSNAQGAGPGEASVFVDASGAWLLYSPWRSMAPKPDIPPRPVFIARIGFLPSGPYLAAGGPPQILDLLGSTPLWSTAS